MNSLRLRAGGRAAIPVPYSEDAKKDIHHKCQNCGKGHMLTNRAKEQGADQQSSVNTAIESIDRDSDISSACQVQTGLHHQG